MAGDKSISQKERVFRAVLELLGDKYDPSEPVAKHFVPINTMKGFSLPTQDKPDWNFKTDIRDVEKHKSQGLSINSSESSQRIHIPRNLRKRLDKVGQVSATQFYRGPLSVEYQENPLLTKLIELAKVPRGAIFESFRRDSRLNGGVKRVWKKSNTQSTAINEEKYLELKNKDTVTKSLLSELKKNQESRNLLLLQLQTRKFELFLKANNLDPDDFSSELFNDLLLKKSA